MVADVVDGATAAYVTCVVVLGSVLHPELKAFYARGYGDMKNTVSAIDMSCAVVFLALCRCCFSRCATKEMDCGAEPGEPFRSELFWTLRWVAAPGFCVFGVITLSTLANFLSYEIYAILGPVELVFVCLLSRCLHPEERQTPLLADAPAVLLVCLGAGLFAFSAVASGGGEALSPSLAVAAVLTSLACRACQALTIVVLRSGCLRLLRPSPGRRARSVAEVAQWKLAVTALFCIPYAFVTEGLQPWRTLATQAFWHDGAAPVLLLGSVFITLAFQATTVGMNGALRSPTAAVLTSSLQPLLGIGLALLLAGHLSGWLRVKGFEATPASLAGVASLIAGLAVHAAGRWRRAAKTHSGTPPQEESPPSSREPALELLNQDE